MKLYEIANEYRSVFDQLSEITDLNDEIINDTLSPVKADFNDKAISLTSYFRNLEAEANAIKEAESMMSHRRKFIEKKIENLKKYLKSQMKATGITKISCPYFSVTLSKTKPKVDILDSNKIPEDFMKTVIKKEPDKDKILKSGGCEGAEILENYSLRIS